MSERAVFLDRDGTINEDPGFLADPTRVKLLPGVREGLRRLYDLGFKLIIVSNQSGVGRGLISHEALAAVNRRIFELAGVQPHAIYMCYHHPEEALGDFKIACDCRKPAIGLIEQGVRELGIELEGSWMIGDREVDLECGRSAGLTRVLVLTGHGRQTLELVEAGKVPAPDHVADDLDEAATWIARNL